MILAILLAAAATVTPEVADSGWISGNTLTTILSILCGAGGIVGGKMWGDRSTKKREEEIRAQIANELRAKIVNDPLHISKVQNCVSIGECNRRMKDLDEQRLRPVGHGGIADGITESLERLVDDVEGKVATASAAVEALG